MCIFFIHYFVWFFFWLLWNLFGVGFLQVNKLIVGCSTKCWWHWLSILREFASTQLWNCFHFIHSFCRQQQLPCTFVKSVSDCFVCKWKYIWISHNVWSNNDINTIETYFTFVCFNLFTCFDCFTYISSCNSLLSSLNLIVEFSTELKRNTTNQRAYFIIIFECTDNKTVRCELEHTLSSCEAPLHSSRKDNFCFLR